MFYGNEDGNANRIPQNMLGENTLYDIDEMIEWPYSGGNTAARPPPAQTATSNTIRRSRSDSGLHVIMPGPSARQPQAGIQQLSGRERSRFRGGSIAHQYASVASHHSVPSNNYVEGAPTSSLTEESLLLLPPHGTVPSTGAEHIITQGDPPLHQFLGHMLYDHSQSRPNNQDIGRPQHLLPLAQGHGQLTNNTASQLTLSAIPIRRDITAPLHNFDPYYYDPPDAIATTDYNTNPRLPSNQIAISAGSSSNNPAAAANDIRGPSPHSYRVMSSHNKSTMPSPVSESSPPGSSYPRKVSPSTSSAPIPTASEEDRSPGTELVEQPKRFKRTESPRMNDHGKMTCKFAECAGVTFDRKCEWSKHMDKHDRPYKCTAPGCEKLLGFTYSGGLLRHEREVHKMHGGTKAPLYCPYTGCKRSSGDGFTRRENLSEHIRRVHQRATATPVGTGVGGASGGSGTVEQGGRRSVSMTRLKREEGADDIRSLSVDSAAQRTGESVANLKKRRREEADDGDEGAQRDDHDYDDDSTNEHGGRSAEVLASEHDNGGDLRGEVKRLKRELSMRDMRVQELQATVDRLSRPGDQPYDQQQQRSPR